MKIQPILRYVLAEQIVETETKSGILLINGEMKMEGVGYYKGKVLAVGDGIRMPNGKMSPLVVKEGDIIIFHKYTPITVEDKKYLVIFEENIIAKLNE